MRKEVRTDGHDEANSRFSQYCEKRLNVMTDHENGFSLK